MKSGIAVLALCLGLVMQAWAQAPDGFDPSPDAVVHALVVQTNGSVVLGGEFTIMSGELRPGLARVDSSGVLDTNSASGIGGEFPYVAALSAQTDGKLLVAGNFATLAGYASSCLGRLNQDGSFDSGFDAAADSDVYGIVPLPDGKILVWGNFLSLSGQPRAYIGRLNGDGSLDATLKPTINDQVFAVAAQPDGKLVLGGLFSFVEGKVRNGLARLNADGTLDESFDPDPGNFATVSCVVIQPDGKILVAGRFSQLGGKPRTNIGRVSVNGTLDDGFSASVSGGTPVFSMALQADGRIVLGGQLTSVDGQERGYLARLQPDGTLDTTFDASTDAAVSALGLQPDGNLLVGGTFAALGGQPRTFVGRLATATQSTDRFTSDGTSITWARSGGLPEFWAASFESSTNGADWTALGPGTPSPGGWQVTNVTAQPNSFIRGRGYVAAGRRNGSSYFLEKIAKISADTPPLIVVNDSSFGWSQGKFGFNVRGLAGQTAVVDGSTDLVNWIPLSTNRLVSSTFYFSDPGATLRNRYYRARLQ